ncbi:membrane-associated zinc metalloprotease [Denitrovibrio acetiphilus DSM 12809]|uniref:Zinc metalloprotease n=1 Tax=Denitrovibrio acetiphilus (strain DSM 12809 / NBRC 114555 / N2460) TaxID=522772 RepID=D4H3Y7_DENA2|nr:RIP metalloprotease RseP [Denitrovibrio acetiphilus]ADD67298.1 membrane-associated zinc metalloprotease [Denitrovibrio acetiphilus DSM 12809]
MGIISAIFLLGILIFIHELGHFLVAKYNGVLVEKFSIGFGPKIFSRKKGETEYALSAIPLGGFVKMYGESVDSDVDDSLRNRSFAHKPLKARFAIVFAGPLFNFILAVLIYTSIFMIGTPRFLSSVGEVMEGTPAQSAGLMDGDVVKSLDGQPMRYWDEMSSYISEKPGEPVAFQVERGGELLTINVTPEIVKDKNIFGEDMTIGRIGVQRGELTETFRTLNPAKALYKGAVQTYNVSELMVMGVVKIFQKVVPADNLGGPIMIVKMAKDSAETGIISFLSFMAIISINLGILNLLPIPVLDGGHLMFFTIEGIIRRPVSIKIREYANMAGLSLLMFIMFFAFYNDIMRFFK